MKRFFLKKEDIPIAKIWLLENIGSENARWWFDSDPLAGSIKVGDEWMRGTIVWFDVLDEESANLTCFMMRWK